MPKKIYCVGGAATDRKLKSFTPLINGTSNLVTATTHFGGVARNVAENLANWTSNIFLHTIVGEDDDGVHLLSSIKRQGVDISQSIILKAARTANYYAVLDPDGELHISLADMAIFDLIPFTRFSQGFSTWDEGSIVFMDTNLTPEIIAAIMRIANEKMLRLCVDPVSLMKSQKIGIDLHGIYLIKPNPVEAQAITGVRVDNINQALIAGEKLLELGAENAVITLGKDGYVIVNHEIKEHVSIEPIFDVINVNGAGDAFMAGIIYGMQQGFSLRHACQWGSAAAAFTVSSPDTVAGNLTSSQLQAFIHNQKIITGRQHAEAF
ncbi:MAG TPA: carbohydrate kinase family protein [Gammaproteobacteria bacterium]|jgi:pseudouridine kinase|nr:carbohydrate kinase family protein [Gammaproteobacteria bacterium]